MGNRKFQRMLTVRQDQIDLFFRIFCPVQVEQFLLIECIRKAVVIHLFDEVFELNFHALLKGCPRSLFGENIGRQVFLALKKDEYPLGAWFLLTPDPLAM